MGAHDLLAAGHVGADGSRWLVRGEDEVYEVGPGPTCTCPWVRKHGTGRGPCKHILAVAILLRAGSNGQATTS